MSGHSKWSTIKRKKGVEDQKRGQMFTKLARAITLAVREGGGIDDPASNFKLRLAMDRAKQVNMPKDNMQRAIDRGTGKGGEADVFESIVYEGYGPEGIALLIETATDNKQRTAAQIKFVLDRNGGSLGAPGSVAFQFDQQGLISVDAQSIDEETLFEKAAEAGALDIEESDTTYDVYTSRDDLHRVKDIIEQLGGTIREADLFYRPKTPLMIEEAKSGKLFAVLEQLEDLEDVQKVYTNADFITAEGV